MLLGNVLDIGTPSDDTVTLAKMASGTDGNIISYDTSGNPVAVATGTDGQVLTSSGAGAVCAFEDAAGGLTEADTWRITSDQNNNTDGDVASSWERDDTYGNGNIGTGMTESSGIFTFPSTGFWLVLMQVTFWIDADTTIESHLAVTTDNSSYNNAAYLWSAVEGGVHKTTHFGQKIVDVTSTTNVKVKLVTESFDNATSKLMGDTSENLTSLTFIRLGDT
jgi:hypothetical protein